ncbi:polymorphic transmembrane cluster 2 transmembrane protein 2 [Biomphalaria pfeifferi]|uniref:Polymorphic transmembrane cluster 2 transmembrane protein 2 n=1 Tax=Biomphalaria pfeifferi TaxID=112525 RepID=A0AAD8C5R4_BIOPF|nr:polymorphic transmembrane cluster 2 transmembrane protein 2 [Biomphalaria pfeifferi]
MERFILLSTAIIALLHDVCVSEVNITCRHVEKGSPVVIHFLWKPNSLEDTVIVSEIEGSRSSPMMICHVQDLCQPTNEWVLKSKTNPDSSYEFQLHKTQVTTTTHHTTKMGWTVLDVLAGKPPLMCMYQVYVKAQSIECDFMSEDEIHIFCTTPKVYPKAKCTFYISAKDQISFELDNVIDSHHNKSDYYVSSCTAIKPILLHEIGLYKVQAIIYPNVTGTKSDITYGTNITKEINFHNCLLCLVDQVIV